MKIETASTFYLNQSEAATWDKDPEFRVKIQNMAHSLAAKLKRETGRTCPVFITDVHRRALGVQSGR